MSKIGKQPIIMPDSVSFTQEEDLLSISGEKGAVTVPVLDGISVSLTDGVLKIDLVGENAQARSNWGTMRSLVQNAVDGVVNGHVKKLEIEGVGYRVTATSPKELVFNLGFSHSISFPIPGEVTAEIADNKITISGANKELVGQVASNIRKLKKPEPYKGKGIRYKDEVVRRKAGKKAT